MKHARIHYQHEARKAQAMTRHDYLLATILALFTLGAMVFFLDAETPAATLWFGGMVVLGFAGFAYIIGKDDQ
jgi:hypothetical protein